MHRVFILVTFLISTAVCAQTKLTPQLTPQESVMYENMLKTDRAAAEAYQNTRNYLSLCRQVVANPNSAIELAPEPDSYRRDYVSSTEQKIVDQAITMNIAAMLSRRH